MQPKNPTDKPQRTYRKHHSFSGMYSRIAASPEKERSRALALLNRSPIPNLPGATDCLKQVRAALEQPENSPFVITAFIADELSRLTDDEIPLYLYHRYRYDIFPIERRLDDFPPYIQIEPCSACNYRCVFCYQTDAAFSSPKNGHMGVMPLERFKRIVDEIEGKIAFGSLASRGEPLMCPDIDAMLEYCQGKFLDMKLNTNASMLTEAHAHAMLSGGLRCIVFSADAADPEQYRRYRVGGQLEKVLKNVAMFERIRAAHYPESPVITRVSGVLYNPEEQDLNAMVQRWGDLVDQVSFVQYNPWENVYDAPESGVHAPCSELWRRLFVWYDGVVNPCNNDYRSTLALGTIEKSTIHKIWNSRAYNKLRQCHIKERKEITPCRCCTVV